MPDLETLKRNIGRRVEWRDVLTPRLVDGFRATLGQHLAQLADDAAPLGLHWCLIPGSASMDALGADGHPAADPLIPQIPGLPRRMWAGGELEFIDPLRVGDEVLRQSTLTDVQLKEGRSGVLCFVTVQHEYSSDRGLAIRERQDIVYRSVGAARPVAPVKPAEEPLQADLTWTVVVSPMLLFRYSALTFNAHRIHYDEAYAMQVEGHAGLLVHGPLQATLLMNLAATLTGRAPRLFSYRGLSPLIASHSMSVKARCIDGDHLEAWTEGPDGRRCLQASAT
jgi:3-methylfumaryl-CoA hydratase